MYKIKVSVSDRPRPQRVFHARSGTAGLAVSAATQPGTQALAASEAGQVARAAGSSVPASKAAGEAAATPAAGSEPREEEAKPAAVPAAAKQMPASRVQSSGESFVGRHVRKHFGGSWFHGEPRPASAHA